MRVKTLLWLLLCSPATFAANLENTIFERVGQDKKLDPTILYAVALAESAYSPVNNGMVGPYVYTLRTLSKPYYCKTKEEAVKTLRMILKETRSVDVGLMQVNVRWHGHRVNKPEDLLDAETNVRVAADILNERLRANDNNWTVALGQYHSFDPIRSERYAQLVLSIYEQLVNGKGSEDTFIW